jgi:HPt (histidine-containing phosphotransfer) domain-containing protein
MTDELKDEILTLLLQRLPADFAAMTDAYTTKNYPELLKHVHKLHGVVCYTGAVELRRILAELERELKNTSLEDNISSLMRQLTLEIKTLLQS